MAIDGPVSDTSRATQHEPDQEWPTSVVLQVGWNTKDGYRVRTAVISADQFFGRGNYGAPMSGDAVISMIEQARRAGPPPPAPIYRKAKDANSKVRTKNKRHRAGRTVADKPRAAIRSKRKGSS